MARYLSGFDLPADSNPQYTQHPEYQQHKASMAKFWEKVRTQSIEPTGSVARIDAEQEPEWRCLPQRPHGGIHRAVPTSSTCTLCSAGE
ncbi:MAG: hypothetical protein U1F27_10655 [Turneriella sp.]